jgi:heme oxygenase
MKINNSKIAEKPKNKVPEKRSFLKILEILEIKEENNMTRIYSAMGTFEFFKLKQKNL